MTPQRIHLLLVAAAPCRGAAGSFVTPAAPSRFRRIMDAMRSHGSVTELAPRPLAGGGAPPRGRA